MNKRADRFLVVGFLTILFSLLALFIILPSRTFSDTENRKLHQLPQMTWDKIWSKTFSSQAETYFTDQFPYRESWVWAKSILEQSRLQQENNGIYRGKDGYLLEKFGEPDKEKLQQYAGAIKEFSEKNPDAAMTFLLAPTSIGIYAERLPWMANSYPQSKVNSYIGGILGESLTYIDGFDFLTPAASKEIYYRTDHHWTTYGAYLAYRAYCERMGWEPLSKDDFDVKTVSDSFLGSYHTRGQFFGVQPDTIQAYVPKNLVPVQMTIVDTGEVSSSLYKPEFLLKKDKYSYFLGGVHALVTIKSQVDATQKKMDKLLVIKDSYAHSVIPFLAQNVSQIDVIDIRYYNGSISEYMKANGIKNVLLLFNTTTFVNGNEILKLKY